MKIYTEEEWLNRMASLCSSSEHCATEIADKMRRGQLPEEAVARIVKRLLDEHFIDDERFARAFVRDKYRFDKWGVVKISQALKLKRIKEQNIQIAFDEIDRDEYLANLKSLLDAKRRNIKAKDDYELKGKLIRFALGKGYEMQDILDILKID